MKCMPLPDKKYNTLVIDPPWDISLTGIWKKRENRKLKLDYVTMSLQEIKEIPIRNILEQGSHVYLWATNKTLSSAFDVLKEWGCSYHLTLVWCKPSFIAPCLAYQFATEFILLGFYGKPMQKFSGEISLNWFKATQKRNGHSSKPEVFYQIVKKMSPEPRLDLFSRRKIEGFDGWNNGVSSNEQRGVEGE